MEINIRPGQLPVLKTKRLVLRDILPSDISADYLAWLNDPETTEFLEIKFTPQTPELVRSYVDAKLADVHGTMHFGIYDQEGARLVGTVTLPKIDRNHATADLSFVIGHPAARGQGYGTEAVQAVCYFAFNHAGIEMLWAGYYEGHSGSASVLKKSGFKVEGCLAGAVRHQGRRIGKVLVGMQAHEFKPNFDILGGQATLRFDAET